MAAHRKAIKLEMLLPGGRSPVEWVVIEEAAAVKRLVRTIRRAASGGVQDCDSVGLIGRALQLEIMSEK